MSFLDEIKKLTRPFDDDDDEFWSDDEAATSVPVGEKPAEKPPEKEKKSSFFSDGQDAEQQQPAPRPAFGGRREKLDSKVVNIGQTQQRVVLVKPERFEAAAAIADHLREKHTVVINLENTNKDTARRLIDFLSGVAYAHEGQIKKIASSTYLITPFNVDLSGEPSDDIETNGLYL